MRILRTTFLLGLLFLLALAACGPQTTLTSTEAPAKSSNAPAKVPSAAPSLVPINLAGPVMAVGSTWPYVDGTTLVAVPSGEFSMGHGGFNNPEHQVTLSDFWIYNTEVTNQQYAVCVAAGQCTPPNSHDNPGYTKYAGHTNPVSGVTYDQAAAYCTFVHGRLPTEAEWEKTARGPNGNIYPWGNGAPTCDLLNKNGCVGNTSPVTDYPAGASYYGALDMEGNVYEWVADWYKQDYYLNSPANDPLGPETGRQRSVRSSGFNSGANQTQAASRYFSSPDNHRANLGFRCAVDDPTYFAAFCEQVAQYGTAPGGSSKPGQDIVADCPNIDLTSNSRCGKSYTQVNVTSDTTNVKTNINNPPIGCTQISGGLPGTEKYLCTVNNAVVTLSGSCTYNNLGSASCPAHYKLDAGSGMCTWDGTTVSGGQCLPGMTYDPAMQCCTVDNPAAGDFPLCQVGSTLVNLKNGKYGCLGNVVAKPDPLKTVTVTLPGACKAGGPSCKLTIADCKNTCDGLATLDSKNCTCTCQY